MTTTLSGVEREETQTADRPHRTGVQRVLIGLEFFISVSALGGGIFLIANPQTGIPISFLESAPFTSWVLSGVALIFFVGLLLAAAAVSELLRMPFAKWAHVGVVVGLLVWIVAEPGWIVVELGGNRVHRRVLIRTGVDHSSNSIGNY